MSDEAGLGFNGRCKLLECHTSTDLLVELSVWVLQVLAELSPEEVHEVRGG